MPTDPSAVYHQSEPHRHQTLLLHAQKEAHQMKLLYQYHVWVQEYQRQALVLQHYRQRAHSQAYNQLYPNQAQPAQYALVNTQFKNNSGNYTSTRKSKIISKAIYPHLSPRITAQNLKLKLQPEHTSIHEPGGELGRQGSAEKPHDGAGGQEREERYGEVPEAGRSTTL